MSLLWILVVLKEFNIKMTIKGNPSRIYYSLQEVNFMRVFNKWILINDWVECVYQSSVYYQSVHLCFSLVHRIVYLCGNAPCLCYLMWWAQQTVFFWILRRVSPGLCLPGAYDQNEVRAHQVFSGMVGDIRHSIHFPGLKTKQKNVLYHNSRARSLKCQCWQAHTLSKGPRGEPLLGPWSCWWLYARPHLWLPLLSAQCQLAPLFQSVCLFFWVSIWSRHVRTFRAHSENPG